MDELVANVMRSKPKDRYLAYNPFGFDRIHSELAKLGIIPIDDGLGTHLSAFNINTSPMESIPARGVDNKALAFIIDPYDLMIADSRVYWVHVPLDAIRSVINLYVQNTPDLKGIKNLVIDWKSTDGSILDRIKAQEFQMGIQSS